MNFFNRTVQINFAKRFCNKRSVGKLAMPHRWLARTGSVRRRNSS